MHTLIQLIPIPVVGVMIAGMWMTFVKAGQPGWWTVLPVFNLVGIIRVAGEPMRFLWFMLIPVVNIVLLVGLYLRLARFFGKGAWFGWGLVFLPFVFFPVVGFGKADYQPVVA